MSMYADDPTLYMFAITVKEITATLKKDIQPVFEWVTNNRLVLNISSPRAPGRGCICYLTMLLLSK